LYHNISNVPPLDGYEDVVYHADPYSFGVVDPDTGETIQECDAKALAEYIRQTGEWRLFRPKKGGE